MNKQNNGIKKTTLKAVALSALVFPGAGHIYLKRYITAIPFLGSAAICTYMLGVRIFSKAMAVFQEILNSGLAPDMANIRSLLNKHMAQQPASELELLHTLTIILVVTWLVAIIDCYRMTNKTSLENYQRSDNKGSRKTQDNDSW